LFASTQKYSHINQRFTIVAHQTNTDIERSMKRHLRFFATVIFALLLITTAIINWRLYYKPEIRIVEGDSIDHDALCHLRYLRDAMQDNAAAEMQDVYPEGYVFFNVI
jgi:hypothetical protein